MGPIVRSLSSYVKDTQLALQIFCKLNFLGEDKLTSTMNITSLYTVNPDAGLLAHKIFFDLRPVKEPSFLELINNSSSLNKENHNREGGFDTRSYLAQSSTIFLLRLLLSFCFK